MKDWRRKSKVGLVIGKFYPPHLGHLQLVDFGIESELCVSNDHNLSADNASVAESDHGSDPDFGFLYNAVCPVLVAKRRVTRREHGPLRQNHHDPVGDNLLDRSPARCESQSADHDSIETGIHQF